MRTILRFRLKIMNNEIKNNENRIGYWDEDVRSPAFNCDKLNKKKRKKTKQ